MSEAKPKKYLDRRQLLQRYPYSYPCLWGKMRRGEFPLPRVLGGKNIWAEDELDAYDAALPRPEYKGDGK
jgi:predicted DNA-binding transcriptional regulator AlpA